VLDWVTLPAEVETFIGKGRKPTLSIKAGTDPGAATITISIAGFNLNLPAAITNGVLAIDTSKLPFLIPKSVGGEIQKSVDGLNEWFEENGKRLAPPAFGEGQVSLRKVPIAGSSEAGPAVEPVFGGER
jgi:hypothetical protein